jgi:hypothetical protein
MLFSLSQSRAGSYYGRAGVRNCALVSEGKYTNIFANFQEKDDLFPHIKSFAYLCTIVLSNRI